MVGEELNAMMRGNKWIAEMLRSEGDPELVTAMRKAARLGYEGIPEAVWAKIPEDIQTQIIQHLGDAQEAWTSAMQDRMQQLLA